MSECSPLAPKELPTLPVVAGVKLAAIAGGLRYQGRPDLLLATFDDATVVAGVFAKSSTAASPVHWCRAAMSNGKAKALLVNAGNANSFTGKRGEEAIAHVVAGVSDALGCDKHDVFISSTGVIGEPLPHAKITALLPSLKEALGDDDYAGAAHAIRTTDTFSKMATRQVEVNGKLVTINGITKGSGMIAPNMATMLGYVFTDVAIDQAVLQQCLSETNEASFNSITVDSDSSTNDTVLAFATGAAGNEPITNIADAAPFAAAFKELMIELAQLIVRDGEGATKFVTITVDGAVSDASAKNLALSIANSPLVKTAIAGEDPNWGRVVMAVGKTDEPVNQSELSVSMGGVLIAKDGQVIDGYDETPVAEHMKTDAIDIAVTVGKGAGVATVWTCDLTHGYITINADYRS